ncbi:hypothetical protein [Demequina iriomotensis]|uniref:hypothetical protein n=1 Tax=Demequina iriomotensis TaxID=1536641 RepID=UPI00078538F6|nr:hypothetical protein [Demequina iriomotensis]
MHPIARRCAQWAAGLVLVGTFAIVVGPEIVLRVGQSTGAGDEVVFWILTYVIGGIRLFAVPIAAALVGAAVVVQVLAPARTDVDPEVEERHAA